MWTAHENNVVGVILAYLVNNGFGIGLQTLPRVVYRFVVEFVQHIGVLAILLCHSAKEGLGFFGVHLVRMPVDDDVCSVLDGCIDHSGYALFCKLRIF